MRLGVGLFPYDRWGGIDALVRAVSAVEAAGFDEVMLPEHLVMPVRPDVPPLSVVWYENFVLGAFLAAATSRLRIAMHALVVPYRHPVHLAKLVSTLDVVSGGRLTLVAGTGWLRGEFRILGVPFAERGARTDEYLRAMKVLWTEDEPTFDGEHVAFSRLAFEPKCVQRPHVPIWIAGSGRRPLERVVEVGDGWAPMTSDLDELRSGIAHIQRAAAARGRDLDRFALASGISVGAPDAVRAQASRHVTGDARTGTLPADPSTIIDAAHEYAEAGVTNFGVNFTWDTPDDFTRMIGWLGERVVPQLQAV